MPRQTFAESFVGVWNKTCTIKTNTGQRSPSGQRIPAWTELPGHENIPCRKSIQKQGAGGNFEQERAGGTITLTGQVVLLNGYFPAITEEMVAEVDGIQYDIEGVQHTSDDQFTYLSVEKQS